MGLNVVKVTVVGRVSWDIDMALTSNGMESKTGHGGLAEGWWPPITSTGLPK